MRFISQLASAPSYICSITSGNVGLAIITGKRVQYATEMKGANYFSGRGSLYLNFNYLLRKMIDYWIQFKLFDEGKRVDKVGCVNGVSRVTRV